MPCKGQRQQHLPVLLIILSAATFGLAVFILVWSHRAFQDRVPVADYSVDASQYSRGVEFPERIHATRADSPLLVRFEAPLDQSWAFLECELIDSRGRVAGSFFVQLEYYHGVLDGIPWEKGARQGMVLVPVKGEGPFGLRVRGSGGHGDAAIGGGAAPSGPPVDVAVLTGVPAVRALTWAGVASLLASFAFLLRALRSLNGRSPAPPRRSSSGKPRFLFIDGLRGIAVLAVLACHFLVPEISDLAEPLRDALGDPLATLLRHGDLGVEIFFVLSGFVIAFTVAGQAVSPGFTGRFVARRAVRLDPPYYVALLIMLTVAAMDHHDGLVGAWRQFGGLDTAVINMFYLQDLLHRPTPLDISWSLCLEIQFYLAFITLCALAQFLAQRTAGRNDEQIQFRWLLVLTLPLLAFSLWCWFPQADRFDFLGTWFRFGLGALTCWAFMNRISPLWLYAALAAVLIPSLLVGDLRSLTAVGTAAAIYAAGRTGRLTTWLSGPIIQFFGRLSYSMYLIHLAAGIFLVNMIWSRIEPTPGNALLLVPVGIAGAVVGSLALYLLFERPSVALSRRIRKRPPEKHHPLPGSTVQGWSEAKG